MPSLFRFFMYIVKLKLRFMKFLVAAMLNGSDSRGGILGARRWDPKTLSRMEKFSSLNCSSVDGDDDEPAWPFPFPPQLLGETSECQARRSLSPHS